MHSFRQRFSASAPAMMPPPIAFDIAAAAAAFE